MCLELWKDDSGPVLHALNLVCGVGFACPSRISKSWVVFFIAPLTKCEHLVAFGILSEISSVDFPLQWKRRPRYVYLFTFCQTLS